MLSGDYKPLSAGRAEEMQEGCQHQAEAYVVRTNVVPFCGTPKPPVGLLGPLGSPKALVRIRRSVPVLSGPSVAKKVTLRMSAYGDSPLR